MSENSKLVQFKRIIELISPSSISALFCIVISLIIAIGVIFLNRFESSILRLDVKVFQSKTASISSSHLAGSILQNTVIRNLPLLLFWSLVGIVVYLVATDVVRSLQSAIELRKELDYVHVHKKQLIRNVISQIVVRALVLVVWLPYLYSFFHRILAYGIKYAILATDVSSIYKVVSYVIVSALIMALGLHVNVIMLRLLFLKPRLIGDTVAK